MTVFEQGLAAWPVERAQAFMEQRRQQALYICSPAAAAASPYFPFSNGDYPHAASLRSLIEAPWNVIMQQPPADLIPVDPFEPSPWRKSGTRLWDAAVGIRASSIRPPHVIRTRNVPGIRGTNTLWTQQLVPALGRVGRLMPDTEFQRPQGPFIFDMVMDPRGWDILEGAHALAHRVGDIKPKERKKTMLNVSSTRFHTQRFLVQLLVCRAYGLPMDVICLDEGIKGLPDIRQYGIEIKSSSYFRTPVLRVPVDGSEAARPDETMALINASVFIEPHPHGFTTSTGNWKEVNRWACNPTVVMISGWELMDVVAHQALCSADPDDKGEPVCYGMSPVDLQSPDTFWAYLRYASMHKGMPAVDNQRYWYVDDWLDSTDYKAAVSEAPPLPCRDCMRINMRSEGAPKRPLSKPPKALTPAALKAVAQGRRKLTEIQQEWMDWEAQLDEVYKIVERATVYYESRRYGHLVAPKLRAFRIGAHRRRLNKLREILRLNKVIVKLQTDHREAQLTLAKRQRDALIVALQQQGNTHAVNRN